MKRILVATIAIALLSAPLYAQARQRQGGGERQSAPSAQSRPAGPPPSAQHAGPPPQGARPNYGNPSVGHANPRPPMPSHRPGYNTHPYPYRPYAYPYYARPYGPYAYPYYGSSYGWGIPYSFSFSYEKHVDESAPAAQSQEQGVGFLLFAAPELDASVYVDGFYEGIVEHFTQKPLPLTAGDHTVEIRSEARSFKAKIRLINGQTITIQ